MKYALQIEGNKYIYIYAMHSILKHIHGAYILFVVTTVNSNISLVNKPCYLGQFGAF